MSLRHLQRFVTCRAFVTNVAFSAGTLVWAKLPSRTGKLLASRRTSGAFNKGAVPVRQPMPRQHVTASAVISYASSKTHPESVCCIIKLRDSEAECWCPTPPQLPRLGQSASAACVRSRLPQHPVVTQNGPSSCSCCTGSVSATFNPPACVHQTGGEPVEW
jgi:hypothetical protein